MIKVAYSPAFSRTYKKFIKTQPGKKQLFQDKLSLFINDPYHPQLRTHKLKGILKDLMAFSIDYDLRVIFYFTSATEVILEDIGNHNEVY